MVLYEYKCPHELKYMPLMTDFDSNSGTYTPQFTVTGVFPAH